MNLDQIKRNILSLKENIIEAVKKNQSCEDFVDRILDKTPAQLGQVFEFLKFAFEHANNWNLVEEKFATTKTLEIKTDENQMTEYLILEGAYLHIEFSTKEVYGNNYTLEAVTGKLTR